MQIKEVRTEKTVHLKDNIGDQVLSRNMEIEILNYHASKFPRLIMNLYVTYAFSSLLNKGDWLRRPKPSRMRNQHPAPLARGRRGLSPFFNGLLVDLAWI